MKEIGLMGNTMDMVLKHGLEEAGIVGSTCWGYAMVLGCIGFTLEMFMPENGPMGRAMDVEFILATMEADSSGNSNGVSNMGLVITISGS